MSPTLRKRVDARSQVLESLAEKGPLNMWSIKKEKKMVYSTVHKAVNSLKEDGLIEPAMTVNSEKGGKTEIYRLTFRGFLTYLASYQLKTAASSTSPSLLESKNWDAFIDKYSRRKISAKSWNDEYLKDLKEKHTRERGRFLEDLQKLAAVVNRNGKLTNYPLFKECRVFEKHFGIFIYLNFVDIARFTCIHSPFGLDAAKLRVLRKLGEKPRGIHSAEEEVFKRVFAEQFLQRITVLHHARVPNKNLRAFAEMLKKKREDEIKYLAAAVDLFS
jgi:predicted ArsR family transcriptional regulator